MNISPNYHRTILQISLPALLLTCFIVFAQGLVRAESSNVQPYYVRYNEGYKNETVNQIREIGGTINHDLSRWNLLAVSIPLTNLKQLNSFSTVSSFEPVPSYELTDEEYPFGLDMVQALDVWDFDRDGLLDPGAPTGNGIKVCIIDTGVFDTHKDLAATAINGYSQIDGEEWNETNSGHGTHVAGTVAANMQGSGLAGVAPGVELFIVKVYDNSGGWILGQSNIAAAADTCADNGADIINLSLKGDAPSLEEEEVFQTLYEDDGILVIAAAANDGSSSATEDVLAYPASYDSVVSVAAVTSNFTHASYSNENSQVELAAPGSAVMSTWPTPENGSIPSGSVTDNENSHPGMYIELSSPGTQSSTLVDGGLCREIDQSDDWAGQIVLCQRQDLPFLSMVTHAEEKGAVATIVAWKEDGLMVGSFGSGTSSGPAVLVGKETGDFLRNNKLGTVVTVETHDGSDYLAGPGGYRGLRGTSMASPHVAGVAALVWSGCPELSNQELRQLLSKTASDLGPVGWDFSFGNGIVQAFDAWHSCQPADLGDLARSYGQVRHLGNGSLKLGQLWAANSWKGTYPGSGHDDQNDDGISISELQPGREATVYVQANGQAQNPWISGWLDYNRDGTFSDVEQVVNGSPQLNTISEFTFTVPVTVELNSPINYRFRLFDNEGITLNSHQALTNLPMTISEGEGEDGYIQNIPTAVSLTAVSAAYATEVQTIYLLAIIILAILSVAVFASWKSITYQIKHRLKKDV